MRNDRYLGRLALTAAMGLATLASCRAAEGGAGFETATDTNGESDTTDTDPTDPTDTSDTGDTGNADFEPVVLNCPAPGSLPFMPQANAFDNPASGMLVADNPRIKDQASDLLGVPGGVVAHTTVDVDTPPAANLNIFNGIKARTTLDEGLVGTPLTAEWVSLWGYDGMAWTELGRAQTSETGSYSFPGIAPNPNPNQPHYAILEGDGSCTPHYSFVLPAGTQVIVTDIDGTLTLADEELFTQIMDGAYTPLENMSAANLMTTWASKGYVVVYLTARPHAFRTETRVWLRELGYPVGPVISANTLVFDESARQYKRAWVNRIKNDFGWEVVAAYGNATSDIDAYEDAGIGKDVTFIVGPNAGVADTQSIENNDYTAHIADFVNGQPDAMQP